MGDVTAVVLADQLLLRGRSLQVQVDNNKMDPATILLIEVNGAASLPLRVESTFSVEDDVVRLAFRCALIHALTGDERAVLAVT